MFSRQDIELLFQDILKEAIPDEELPGLLLIEADILQNIFAEFVREKQVAALFKEKQSNTAN